MLEAKLAQAGLARHPLEKSADWLGRIVQHPLCEGQIETLTRIVSLHCQYRFDPDGITTTERLELQRAVTGVISRNREKIREQLARQD